MWAIRFYIQKNIISPLVQKGSEGFLLREPSKRFASCKKITKQRNQFEFDIRNYKIQKAKITKSAERQGSMFGLNKNIHRHADKNNVILDKFWH